MLLRIYQELLKLYPEDYQKQYKQQILQTMGDVLANEPHANKRHLILIKEIITTPINALEQSFIAFSTRRHTTPWLVISITSLALLAPFFIAIAIDEISEFITGGHLYNTWLWNSTVLFIWIVALPFASLVLSLSTYLVSLIRHRNKKMFFLGKKYWLTIITILLSVGILSLAIFHDSMRCWMKVTSVNNIISCTQSGVVNSDKH